MVHAWKCSCLCASDPRDLVGTFFTRSVQRLEQCQEQMNL